MKDLVSSGLAIAKDKFSGGFEVKSAKAREILVPDGFPSLRICSFGMESSVCRVTVFPSIVYAMAPLSFWLSEFREAVWGDEPPDNGVHESRVADSAGMARRLSFINIDLSYWQGFSELYFLPRV
jgi:hypothetical protein